MTVPVSLPESTWPLWIDWITSTTTLAGIAIGAFGLAWLWHLERNDHTRKGDK